MYSMSCLKLISMQSFILIGISGAIAALIALVISPFAKQLINWTEEVNMIVICMVGTNIRIILYAVIM